MQCQVPNMTTSSRIAIALLLGLCFAWSPANADSYIDGLRDAPETILFRAYDTQAEIDADINAVKPENRKNPPVYDPAQDAAKWTFTGGDVSVVDQLRPEFSTVSSGNLLFVWEARWDTGFSGDLGELKTHKAFQLSNKGGGDERRIELRTRFSKASGSDVAKVDARGYIWDPSGQPLPGQVNEFTIGGGKWTRFWGFVDFDNRQFSFWVADEDTGPVKLFDQLQYSDMSGGLDNFWFEFNSSQSGPESPLSIWARNFIVQRDVSNVQNIVSQGAPVRPEAIADLSAN